MRQLALVLITFLGLSQFSIAEKTSSARNFISDTLRIEDDLKIITKRTNSRNYKNIETLNFVAEYIFSELSKNCDTVYFQPYFVNGIEYKNVIGPIIWILSKNVITL